MSIYDRDYYRQPDSSSVGRMNAGLVTTWLIIINIAVFVIDRILFYWGGVYYPMHLRRGLVLPLYPLEGLGEFSLLLAIRKLEVWRFVTYQFLHAGLAHLTFNMLALYFFGPLIEFYLGSRRFLAFYLLSGVGGPLAYIGLAVTGLLVADGAVAMVGASAGIFGILIAAAKIAPDATVLLYGMIPMKLKTLAWTLLAVAIYTVLFYGHSGQHNAGGEAAHLGGAAVGWLLIRNPHWLNVFEFGFRRYRPPF